MSGWSDEEVRERVALLYPHIIERGEVPVIKRGTGMIGEVCGVCLNSISTTTGVISYYCEHCEKYGVDTGDWYE